MKDRAGVFVSIKKKGCCGGAIGTFAARQSKRAEEIMNNAVSSGHPGSPAFPR